MLEPEAVIGALVVLGGVVMLLSRLNWLGLGKKPNGDGEGKCPDPACQSHVNDLRNKVDKLDNKVDKIQVDIGWIRGRMEINDPAPRTR